jgi:2-amino-4-hydroxy-6-hydroxymethyldihydropteridine diphosphokinase
MSITAYVGLGSNLGDRSRLIQQAVDLLGQTPGIQVCRLSDVVETQPLAGLHQPLYLNAVCEIRTTLGAPALLERLTEVESALGRVREHRWGPRTMDLDVLLFGDQVVDTPALQVVDETIYYDSRSDLWCRIPLTPFAAAFDMVTMPVQIPVIIVILSLDWH